MNTTVAATTDNETVRKINRHMLKFIAVRVITPIAVTVACTVISNAIDKKMTAAEESTETTND